MTEVTEQPFRPREKLIEKQKYYQNIRKHTYLKGPFDRITSVAIPAALAATSLFLIVSFNIYLSYEKLMEKIRIYPICMSWMNL